MSGFVKTDHPALQGHKAHNVGLGGEDVANHILNKALKFMAMRGWIDGRSARGWRVYFNNRKCRRRWGTCWRSRKEIILYPDGRDVGTLLHEIAHVKFGGHGPDFKNVEKNLFVAWEREFSL